MFVMIRAADHPGVPTSSIQRVATGISGRGTDRAMAMRVLLPVAIRLLSLVQAAFLVKSRGLVGPDGIQWAPLSPKTIAARRTTPAELRSLGIRGKRVRGLLTPTEDRRWRGIFASRLAAFRAAGMGDGAARARAAANAWAILKGEGAQTKLQVLGSRKVDIGRDTGALLRSLTPGVRLDGQLFDLRALTAATGAVGQLLDVLTPGRFTVGSNVPYAGKFHAKRPLWPTNGALPPAWQQELAAVLVRSIVAEAGRPS